MAVRDIRHERAPARSPGAAAPRGAPLPRPARPAGRAGAEDLRGERAPGGRRARRVGGHRGPRQHAACRGAAPIERITPSKPTRELRERHRHRQRSGYAARANWRASNGRPRTTGARHADRMVRDTPTVATLVIGTGVGQTRPAPSRSPAKGVDRGISRRSPAGPFPRPARRATARPTGRAGDRRFPPAQRGPRRPLPGSPGGPAGPGRRRRPRPGTPGRRHGRHRPRGRRRARHERRGRRRVRSGHRRRR